MSDLQSAQKWCETLSNDTQAHADLYADDQHFAIDRTMMDDHMNDTVSTKAELVERYGPFANKDADNGLGVHTFKATKYTAGTSHGLIEWDYEVSGLSTFRGIENSEGKTLTLNGSTFLQYDADGKIVHESTCVNDCPAFEQLGVPIARPHYWDADFDPAALAG